MLTWTSPEPSSCAAADTSHFAGEADGSVIVSLPGIDSVFWPAPVPAAAPFCCSQEICHDQVALCRGSEVPRNVMLMGSSTVPAALAHGSCPEALPDAMTRLVAEPAAGVVCVVAVVELAPAAVVALPAALTHAACAPARLLRVVALDEEPHAATPSAAVTARRLSALIRSSFRLRTVDAGPRPTASGRLPQVERRARAAGLDRSRVRRERPRWAERRLGRGVVCPCVPSGPEAGGFVATGCASRSFTTSAKVSATVRTSSSGDQFLM